MSDTNVFTKQLGAIDRIDNRATGRYAVRRNEDDGYDCYEESGLWRFCVSLDEANEFCAKFRFSQRKLEAER